ncbi:cytidine and deoxycytidylate deaminase zinc-binding region domain-containing protein [Malassezia pachydermatis]|uniref:Cytidine and deoxycytidylate deaminase zinc-binding region domain-containing protein n=1 Tax=Malassezia pachydermatis TaxID=77020 RepID=A0A0M8MXT3_9BASI|nr:cytidine and deoxycytidylate deaminase zinc-binding region domain-containing protein [Malassezia pachydermatis]KOS15721.1 cytidine and deoxycytidylate deaminase zinc-binding region domain-containing protein [Malassezia pachydermatis]
MASTQVPPACTPHTNPYGLRICQTPYAGRSLFATIPISANTIIEISPVLLFTPQEYTEHGQYTVLDSYTFVWEKSSTGNTMALALGLGSLFNHHPTSANVSYELDRSTQSIKYRTVRAIDAGEELFICYGAGRMWWESPSNDAMPTTPMTEEHELALFGQLGAESEEEAHRAPVDPSYPAPLWRVTSSPDPKTMPLETSVAWAMDVPPKACSTVVRLLQGAVKNGTLKAGDAHPIYSLRHLRTFRKAREVTKMLDGVPVLSHDSSDALSMLLALTSAHSKSELLSLLHTILADMDLPMNLYQVRVPSGPAPMRDRLAEWSAVWPCVFLPPGAGLSTKQGIPGSDAARATVPVDRAEDARRWSDARAVGRIRDGFARCLRTASLAAQAGEVGVGVYVTSLANDEEAIHVDAFDTRVRDNHPLRHAIPNAVRQVAAIRAQQRANDDAKEAVNGQDYLLTGLSLFITHEPCVYCAMALVHSRVREVFFLYPSPGTGGFCGAAKDAYATCEGVHDGGPYAIHEQSGLNHQYHGSTVSDGRRDRRV